MGAIFPRDDCLYSPAQITSWTPPTTACAPSASFTARGLASYAAVRELLEKHPLAKSFAPEARDKGGDGATVVELT